MPRNPASFGNCAAEPALGSVVSLFQFHPHLASTLYEQNTPPSVS